MHLLLSIAVAHAAGAIDLVKWQHQRKELCTTDFNASGIWIAHALGVACSSSGLSLDTADTCLPLNSNSYPFYESVACVPSVGPPGPWVTRFLDRHRSGRVALIGDSIRRTPLRYFQGGDRNPRKLEPEPPPTGRHSVCGTCV
eukprot:Hpha_TRINITY_DN35693_c0_g1::TRINITY_DN35693_c0_g1_i1::g.68515::m.68515